MQSKRVIFPHIVSIYEFTLHNAGLYIRWHRVANLGEHLLALRAGYLVSPGVQEKLPG